MTTSAYIDVHIHSAPPAIYDALARVFVEEEVDIARWVTLRADGVNVHFYADTDESGPDEAQLLAALEDIDA